MLHKMKDLEPTIYVLKINLSHGYEMNETTIIVKFSLRKIYLLEYL